MLSIKTALFLVVCSLIALFVSAEVIVQDQFDNYVGLPLTGGNATGGYTILNPAIPTSTPSRPYQIQITISDQRENGFNGNAQETFYIQPGTPLFGNATLVRSYFIAAGTSTQQTTQLGNVNTPNTAVGDYYYFFNIPVGGYVALNITYNVTANPVEADLIFILVANPVSVQIVGDPQFVGLRGQSYQVHGVDGAVYNIISEQNTQVNSRFVFLSEGKCPIFNAVPDTNCWSHPGSYLGELSFQQVVDGKIHAGLVSAGSAKNGFSAVQMDGQALKIGDSVSFGTFSISYESTHRVIVQTENYSFELSNSDMFVNQAVRVKTALNKLTAHGLLGQTHSTKVYPTSVRYIQGEVDDYLIGDNDIFGDDFMFNQFQA